MGEGAVSVMVGTGGGTELRLVGGGEPRSDGGLVGASGCALGARLPLPLGVGCSDSFRLLRAERRGVADGAGEGSRTLSVISEDM